jgi:hypothetical protein
VMAVLAFIVFVLGALFTLGLALLAIYNIFKFIIKHRRPRQAWESDDEFQGKVQP